MVPAAKRSSPQEASTSVPVTPSAAPAAPDPAYPPHAEGPARQLQQELERALAGGEGAKWSARRSLAFILVTDGLLWLGLIWAVLALLR